MDIKTKILFFFAFAAATPFGAFMGYAVFYKLKGQNVNYMAWWQGQGVQMLITAAIVAAVIISLYPWIQSHSHRG